MLLVCRNVIYFWLLIQQICQAVFLILRGYPKILLCFRYKQLYWLQIDFVSSIQIIKTFILWLFLRFSLFWFSYVWLLKLVFLLTFLNLLIYVFHQSLENLVIVSINIFTFLFISSSFIGAALTVMLDLWTLSYSSLFIFSQSFFSFFLQII